MKEQSDDEMSVQLRAVGFEPLSVIGRGGMSSLYKVRNSKLGRTEAIKILDSRWLEKSEFVRRLQREAKVIARLEHPNIVKVFGMGILQNGAPYISMECLDGVPLSDYLQHQSRLSVDEFTELFLPLSEALACAHNAGLVHRDIKPSNIFLCGEGTGRRLPKLIDFGIAQESRDSRDSTDQKLTATGHIMGSPAYMSPEQCRGEQTDARSDVYSLGCVMFECLYGAPPYSGSNALEIMYRHTNDFTPSLPHNAAVPPHIESLLLACLAKNRADRPADGAAIAAILSDKTSLPRHPTRKRSTFGLRPFLLPASIVAALVVTGAIMQALLIGNSRTAPSPEDKLYSEKASELFQQGEGALKANDFVRAESLLKKAIATPSTDDTYFFARRRLGMLLCDQGRYEEARVLFGETLHLIEPNEFGRKVEMYLRIAQSLDKQGKLTEARSAYVQTHQFLRNWLAELRTPDRYEYQRQVFWVNLENGEFEYNHHQLPAAERLLQVAIAAAEKTPPRAVESPHTLRCAQMLAAVYEGLGKYKEAIALCDKIASDPDEQSMDPQELEIVSQAKILSATCRQALAKNYAKR